MADSVETIGAVEGAVETAVVDAGAKAKGKGKRGKANIDPYKFMEIWEGSANADEVARRTGLTKNAAQTKASTFRTKYGWDLKEMPRGGGAKLDAAKGKDFLAKLRADKAAALEAAKVETA